MQIPSLARSGFFSATPLRIQTGSDRLDVPLGLVSRTGLREFAQRVVKLEGALDGLRLDARTVTRAGGPKRAALARSGNALVLNFEETAARLTSTEEVNAVTTSYATTRPEWTGPSSTVARIGGTYDGAQGDDTLTFSARVGGTIGSSLSYIEVRDGSGQLIDAVNLGTDPPLTTYTLSNGLELSFGAGSIQTGDTFELDVSTSVPSSVDPDAAFNATGDAAPGFEAGLSVRAGAFRVNGVSILVDAGDSVNDVLAKIDASAAGVTASFDAGTESVVLTQETPGASPTILLTNDNSGFFAATKLSGAVVEDGVDSDVRRALGDVAGLNVQSGTYRVNGETLTIDAANDSLEDVFQALAQAGLTASLDEETGLFSLRSVTGDSFRIDSGSSGIFEALELVDGPYSARKRGARVTFGSAEELRAGLGELGRALQDVLGGDFEGFGSAIAGSVRGRFERALARAFTDVLDKSGSGNLRSGLGIDLLVATGDSDSRQFALDQVALSRAIEGDAEELARFLFATEEEDGATGLFAALDKEFEGAFTTLTGLLGPEEAAGLRLDVSA